MTLKRVVLPAPLGPIRATTSPAPTEKETPSSATTPPKRTLSSRTSSSAISAQVYKEIEACANRVLTRPRTARLVSWFGEVQRVVVGGGSRLVLSFWHVSAARRRRCCNAMSGRGEDVRPRREEGVGLAACLSGPFGSRRGLCCFGHF